MPFTTKQLAALRHDLTSLANIRYDHLTDELLDHYATLTEENMLTGQSFYEASTAAWLAMGDGVGIQQIQERYEKVTRQQIKSRHIAIRKSYLRWPTVTTTLFVGISFAYLLLAVLPVNLAKALSVLLVLSPSFVVLVACITYFRQQDDRQRLVWQFIKKQVDVFSIFLNVLNVIRVGGPRPIFTPAVDTALMIIITVGSLYSTISLAQLTRETFYYKPAF